SIKISPKSDPNYPELITHTSVFIQKIITIAEWGQPPHHYKHFSSFFDILVYNYFDYTQAWHHAFLFQNIEDKHSWFFCFDKTFNSKQIIPDWFMDWWTFYGPIKTFYLHLLKKHFTHSPIILKTYHSTE
ncbi:hypothetical protein CFOL_v3_22943, partial [Cephalotus follicularis]